MIEQQPTVEQQQGEQFLTTLYQQIKDWASITQRMQQVVEFSEQEVENWDTAERRINSFVSLSFNLQAGTIYAGDRVVFATALGRGFRHSYERGKSLRVLFGGSYTTLEKEVKRREREVRFTSRSSANWNVLDLKRLLRRNPRFGDYLYGEFYFNEDTQGVEINCWADSLKFGGRGIGGLHQWPNERLLTPEGLQACVGIVERTIKQAKI